MDVVDLGCSTSIRVVYVQLTLTAVVTLEVQLAVKGVQEEGTSTSAAG